MLGIVLGNLFPDTDNLAVAYATVAALPTHGLHRTFTHSMFTIAALVVALWILAVLTLFTAAQRTWIASRLLIEADRDDRPGLGR